MLVAYATHMVLVAQMYCLQLRVAYFCEPLVVSFRDGPLREQSKCIVTQPLSILDWHRNFSVRVKYAVVNVKNPF